MNYSGQQICGTEGTYNATGRLCKFPGNSMTWFANGRFSGFDDDTTKQVFIDVWDGIASRCNFKGVYTSNIKTANVVFNFGPIDGRGNVLAWSKVFCGGGGQLDQLYDTGDQWSYSNNPPQGKVSSVAVAKHEIGGHLLGLNGHLPLGNLFAATYDPAILDFRAGDVAEMVARYGLPEEPAAPIPVPQPGIPSSPLPPNTPIDFGVLVRLLGAWGIDLAAKMTPAERAFVIDFVLRMIRSFSPQQRMEAAEAMRAAGMPIALD